MDKAGKVLFLDSTHPCLQIELEGMGYQCIMAPEISRDELKKRLPSLTGIIVRSKLILDRELLGLGHNLRFIGRVGSGMENIDVDYARSKGIACLNSPEGNRQAVGEHAVGLLLALMNKICAADREVRNGVWKREANRGSELSDKTVGIIGYGNTGSAFARCLSGLGCHTMAYDKYKTRFGNDYVEEADMDEVFRRADILSLHVPLTEETDYLVTREYLSRFHKPIYFINTSRGRVVCTSDLVDALYEGKVLGAALDVLEYEDLTIDKLDKSALPAKFQNLTSLPNVVLTPHVAGWTAESKIKLARVLADKIRNVNL